ncbi:hypothetical protein KC340_g10089 [Hortaea werneckii]|nr:hypothetical protein KC342_g12798 [Hortaea werneckii]KAI7311724.1 hypothetical protein KC340_g10089 [Hortaea werneckii]KAI7386689.1 hypothetical protein KC328_g9779 [Hortaea werneckii]
MVDTLQPRALGLIVLWPVLATIAVALRVYTRVSMRQFRSDDHIVVVAYVLAVGQTVMVYLYTLKSWQGYHFYDIPDLSAAEHAQASKYDLANQLLYNPILALVKASVICFLWRLKDRRKSIRWSPGTPFGINLGLAIATFVADLCQCTPVSYYWDHYETDKYDAEGNVIEKGGTCIQQVEFFLITAGLSVWTEIILMSISMAVVLSLKMKKASKIAIATVMSLGWIVVMIGITRIALYYYRFQPDNVDRSYSLSYTISGAEVNIAIIASCGPALRAFAKLYIPDYPQKYRRTSRTSNTFYFQRSHARDGAQRLSDCSGNGSDEVSHPDSSSNALQGMDILKTVTYHVNTSSQEAIIPSDGTLKRLCHFVAFAFTFSFLHVPTFSGILLAMDPNAFNVPLYQQPQFPQGQQQQQQQQQIQQFQQLQQLQINQFQQLQQLQNDQFQQLQQLQDGQFEAFQQFQENQFHQFLQWQQQQQQQQHAPAPANQMGGPQVQNADGLAGFQQPQHHRPADILRRHALNAAIEIVQFQLERRIANLMAGRPAEHGHGPNGFQQPQYHQPQHHQPQHHQPHNPPQYHQAQHITLRPLWHLSNMVPRGDREKSNPVQCQLGQQTMGEYGPSRLQWWRRE